MVQNKEGSETEPLVPKKDAPAVVGDEEEQATGSGESGVPPSLVEDAYDIVKIAIPIFVARVSWIGV
jgi:hypothetical protein